MEVWRTGSVKHRLNLPEQQKGSLATFSYVLLLPEVPHTHTVCVHLCGAYCVSECNSLPALCVCVCVRWRSCGVFVRTQEKCVSGTWRTRANLSIVWLYRTAPDVTAWSKLKTRLINSTTHTHTSITYTCIISLAVTSLSSPGVGWRCWPQFYQREDLHCGHGTLPGTEGAPRPQRHGDGALLCRGPLRPQRSWQTRRKDRHLEGGVEQKTDECLSERAVNEQRTRVEGVWGNEQRSVLLETSACLFESRIWRDHTALMWSNKFT